LPIIGFISTKILSEHKDTKNQIKSNKDHSQDDFQRSKEVFRRFEEPEEEIKQ